MEIEDLRLNSDYSNYQNCLLLRASFLLKKMGTIRTNDAVSSQHVTE